MEPGTPQQFDWTLAAIAVPFAGALIAPVLIRLIGAFAGLILALVPAGCFVFFGVLLPPLSSGLVIFGGIDRLKQSGFEFSYAIDGLSVLFVLLINFAAAFALIDHAVSGRPANSGKVLPSMLLLTACLQGLVLADSFFALIIFCALSALATAWIASLSRGKHNRRTLAFVPPAAAAAGTLMLLLACSMLADKSSGFDDGMIVSMTGAINGAWQLRESDLYEPVFAAILAGIAIFAAQGPAAARLTDDPAIPASLSALLFGVAVLIPVYLLMRVHPFLGDTPAWSLAVPLAGGLMLIAGAILALRQRSRMRILAWAAIASSGAMMMMVGTSLNPSVFAAVAMAVAHGLSFTALILTAGRLPGPMPGNSPLRLLMASRSGFAIALLAVLAFAGAPSTLGYLATGTLYAGLWDAAFPDLLGEPSQYAWLLQTYTLVVLFVLIFGHALIVAGLLKGLISPFDRPDDDLFPVPAGLIARAAGWFAPGVLVAAAFAIALASPWITKMLIDPARYGTNLIPYRIAPPQLAGPALWFTLLSLAVAALICWILFPAPKPDRGSGTSEPAQAG